MAHSRTRHRSPTPRARSSRRTDSFSLPKKPSVGPSTERAHVDTERDRGRTDRHHTRDSNTLLLPKETTRHGRSRVDSDRGRTDRHDTGSNTLLLPTDAGSHGRSHRSRSRQRSYWPPYPTCEDERTSLLREAGGRRLLRDMSSSDVSSRGSIDQEPVIEDVAGFVNGQQAEHRYNNVSTPDSSKKSSSSGILTPPSSEDERARRARRRPSRLSTDPSDDRGAPEMGKRNASPYAFKPSRTSSTGLKGSQLLSPASTSSGSSGLQIPSAGMARGTHSQQSSPIRDPEYARSSHRGDAYSHTNRAADDVAIDDSSYDESRSKHGSRKEASYPPAPSSKQNEKPGTGARTSVVDFASPPPLRDPRHSFLDTTRRHTDTADSLPTLLRVRTEQARKMAPLAATGSTVGAAFHPQSTVSSRSGTDSQSSRSRETSRNVSPNFSAQSGPLSPPRSPRASFDSNRSHPGSRPASRDNSHSGSRPSTPSSSHPLESPRLPRTDTDWSNLMGANAARRAKQPSRLTTSMRQTSMPQVPQMVSSPSSVTTPVSHSTLPYPLDDGPPSLSGSILGRDVRKVSEPKSMLHAPHDPESKNFSRSVSPPRSSVASPSVASLRDSRPSVVSRHSSIGLTEVSSPRPPSFVRSSTDEPARTFSHPSAQVRQEIYALSKKALPECRRPTHVTGKDEWYTISGCSSLDFCPDCVRGAFDHTPYQSLIRRSPSYHPSDEIRCALGGKPWIRLAWRMTLLHERTDLNLLKDMVEIDQSNERCPGRHREVRSWYSLRDDRGHFVNDFLVCHTDVRKIERLFPNLTGFFSRLRDDRYTQDSHSCSLHADGNRFSLYTTCLISTHNKLLAASHNSSSSSSSGPPAPDPMPFIREIERATKRYECPRDSLTTHAIWHTHPSVPHLTVCEDCYHTHVLPTATAHPETTFLSRFSRNPHHAPAVPPQPEDQDYEEAQNDGKYIASNDAIAAGGRRSCQLYSLRSRRFFATAVKNNDVWHLFDKAKERRDAERRLVERLARTERRAQRASREMSSAHVLAGMGGSSAGGGDVVGSATRAGFEAAGVDAEDDIRKFRSDKRKIRADWEDNWE